jgi:anti-sigma factor RsiW
MLTCRDVTELTTDYLDHALPLHRRLGMRLHLAYCNACRRHLRQVKATIGLLRHLPAIRPSQAREDELIAMLQNAPPSAG